MKWIDGNLNELGFVGRGRSRHRPRNAPHLYGGPYPFVQTGDVKAAGLRVTEYNQTYSSAGLEQSKIWPQGTLCITIAANIAETAILGLDACFPDSVVGFMANESKCDARFIKYFFDFKRLQYQQISQGATQDNLSLEKLLSFSVHVPARVEDQCHIASILSTYDDLIENNLRRIKLLEESARLLYREWFTPPYRYPGAPSPQPSPTGRGSKGEGSRRSAATRIVDSVPEGWERKKLGEILELKYGKSLKAADRSGGSIPVYGSSGVVGTHDKALVKAPGIVVGRKGNVGTVFWEPRDFWPIDTVYYVATSTLDYYLYHNLCSQTFVSSHGAVPGLNRDFAYSLPVLLPSDTLRRDFQSTIRSTYDQITTLDDMNTNLREARDLLLPKLMNGEIAA